MPPAKKTNQIPVGSLLAGKYRVTREIGRGGMAAVFEAVHVDIGKRVAVKVLNAELTQSAVVVERFVREARAAAAVDSPYICDVYDVGRLDDGRPFLLLELLEGESLYERMIKVRRFDPDFVTRIFSQVCRGLMRAHAASIIHRDLKPENIFLTKGDDGEVVAKILDFGLAKFYSPIDGTAAQQRLTREGAVFGTPAYMSPEQVKGHGEIDYRSDLWAIGCMVYECLTGQTVWTTDQGVAMIFAQVATAELPVPSKVRPDLPLDFDGWFAKALEREPARRFQNARELADELVVALEQSPPSTRQPQAFISTERVVATSPMPQERPPALFATTPLLLSPPLAEPPAPLLTPPHEEPQGSAMPMAIPPATSPQENISHVSERKASDRPSRWTQSAMRHWHPWVTAVGALLVAASGYLIWDRLIRPSPTTYPQAPPIDTQLGSAPSADKFATLPIPTLSSATLPKWAQLLSTGQEALSKGDAPGAVKSFREASEASGSGASRVLLENALIATSSKGTCKVMALGRPRPFDLTGNVRRPDIVQTPHGPLVAWVDDHEVPNQWHAYANLLDDQLRALGSPLDVTPEANSVQEPRLLGVDKQVVLLFSDLQGDHPGVYLRPLTSTGRILGAPIKIVESRTVTQGPSMTQSPRGDLWVAYAEDDDKEASSKVFLHPLSASFRPAAGPVLVTEIAEKQGSQRARTKAPSVAFVGNGLMLTYRVERGPEQWIVRQRIALDDPALRTGLSPTPSPTSDHAVGESKSITERKGKMSSPQVACDPTSCFVVWRDDPTGTNAAYLDPATGTVIWRKRFALRGTQVSVALDGSGGGLMGWYQDGRLRVAPVTRDGIGETTEIAKVSGEQPRPSISKGLQHGSWLLGWSDYEAGHLEAYVGRLSCP